MFAGYTFEGWDLGIGDPGLTCLVCQFFQASYAAPQVLSLGFEPIAHLANLIKHFATIRLNCFRPGLHVCKALGFSLNFENCCVNGLKIGCLLIAGLGLADTESLCQQKCSLQNNV